MAAEIIDLCKVLEKLSTFSPWRRVLLATAGTLQGTLSAYFGSPVTVEVRRQEERGPVILRDVDLMCPGRGVLACRASTEVIVHEERLLEMIREQKVGLGQMIELLRLPATFELEEVGQHPGTFWRIYRLEGDGFRYRIREDFAQILYPDIHDQGA